MSIEVTYDGYISVGGYDLSDHCIEMMVNDGQESRDVTTFGATSRQFRAGLGLATIEATFLNDHSTGSVENVLRAMLLTQNAPGSKSPASSPSVALAGGSTGGFIAGAYRYWLTYTFPSFETAPSTYASVTATSSGDSGVLTSIPSSTEWYATGKNLYRSTAGGDASSALLLASLANSATSYQDDASSGSLVGNAALNQSWQPTSFDVVAKKHDTATSTDNPSYTLEAIVEGDINVLDEKIGEVGQIKAMFRKFGTFTIATA